MIDDGHGEAIEADLQREYGLDLLDVFRGTLSPAKVMRLLGQLDERSALFASLAGNPEFRGWTPETRILADVWDLLARVNTGEKRKPPSYPRPTNKPKHVKKLTVADLPGAVTV